MFSMLVLLRFPMLVLLRVRTVVLRILDFLCQFSYGFTVTKFAKSPLGAPTRYYTRCTLSSSNLGRMCVVLPYL